LAQDECTLAEALSAAEAAGLVMQPGGWRFMEKSEELSAWGGAAVRVTDYGVRREVLLPTGDRLTFVPARSAA
jgi:hypothetical protein